MRLETGQIPKAWIESLIHQKFSQKITIGV